MLLYNDRFLLLVTYICIRMLKNLFCFLYHRKKKRLDEWVKNKMFNEIANVF